MECVSLEGPLKKKGFKLLVLFLWKNLGTKILRDFPKIIGRELGVEPRSPIFGRELLHCNHKSEPAHCHCGVI